MNSEAEHWIRVFERGAAARRPPARAHGRHADAAPRSRRALRRRAPGFAGLYSSLISAVTLFTCERTEALKWAGTDHVQISIQSGGGGGGGSRSTGARRSTARAAPARDNASTTAGRHRISRRLCRRGSSFGAGRRRSSAFVSEWAPRSPCCGCSPTSMRSCRSRAWAAGAGRRWWSLRTATCCPARPHRRSRARVRQRPRPSAAVDLERVRRVRASAARPGCRSRAGRARSDARRRIGDAAAARRCGCRRRGGDGPGVPVLAPSRPRCRGARSGWRTSRCAIAR